MLDISPFSLVFTLFYKYGLGAPKAKKLGNDEEKEEKSFIVAAQMVSPE